ncbi:TetR/AcrR family transcriptional regulator [Rubrivivax benzoatilyticus]|uniref:TetR/AcrR family transcriptional regulator n=1 Tax=Rubrivivax benzoatilyticus TaxID=316997 RepID=A0ABX0HT58_9BURK|nr:TetR/AcrR family transcriptional regulator [Rubrivivax benzoatilyticus]EGJ11056.1 TetR family transcriptional regulator [Rubrivivax benzoatilyticus JA2 = ATCC BAA-35]NHK96934.1 TetR/AcrR family transcriptional regulator [Rubrivivax benzoatilyticus]NHL24649.1 TetR/AcrR family transcriptional regulator [Rubrivivax benzoatilyticus]
MDRRAAPVDEPPRRAYHHGDLRAALREAAERVLVERGAAEVSLREVARAVGVSHAAPYRHYASREALLADIAAGGFDRLRAVFAALPEPADPAARFVAMARAYVDFAVAQPAIYRLMLGPEVRKADHPVLAEAGHRVLGTLRQALVALGVPAPATNEAMAAWGFAHGLAQLLVDGRLEVDPEVDTAPDPQRLVERSARLFIAGLQAGGAAGNTA